MKRILLCFVFATQFACSSFAQIGPVKGKGQEQSTFQTVERLETKNNSLTVTGDKKVLLENQENYLANPSFEHSTFNTSWTVSLGTATVDTTNFYDGKKSMSISLTSANGTIAEACNTPTAQKQGTNLEQSLRVKTTLANLQVCSVNGTTEVQCVNVPSVDQWVNVVATSVAPASGALCVRLKSTTSVTGTVKLDDAYVGINKSISNFSQAKNVVNFVWSGALTATHDTDILFTWSGATINRLENISHSSGVFTVNVTGDYQVKFCPRMDHSSGNASVMRAMIAKVYKNSTTTPLDASGYVHGLAQNNINGGGEPSTGFYANPPPCVVNTTSYNAGDVIRFKAYEANGAGSNTFSWVGGTLEINYFPSVFQQAITQNCEGTTNCENIFSARVSSGDVVSNENLDWINGNCTDASTGRATCVFNSNIFSVAPNCVVVAASSSSVAQLTCSIGNSANTSQVTVDCKNGAADSNQPFEIVCQRVGSDRKPVNNAPLIINSIISSVDGVERSNHGFISFSGGTPTVTRGSSWLGTLTDTNVGRVGITIRSGVFSSSPDCLCNAIRYSALGNETANCEVRANSATSLDVQVRELVGGTINFSDINFNIFCDGPR